MNATLIEAEILMDDDSTLQDIALAVDDGLSRNGFREVWDFEGEPGVLVVWKSEHDARTTYEDDPGANVLVPQEVGEFIVQARAGATRLDVVTDDYARLQLPNLYADHLERTR